jgi:hypothetical protein
MLIERICFARNNARTILVLLKSVDRRKQLVRQTPADDHAPVVRHLLSVSIFTPLP